MTHRMTHLITALLLSTLLGCGAAEDPLSRGLVQSNGALPADLSSDQAALLEALPSQALLSLDLPSAASKPGTQQGALVGETSEFWAHTANTALRFRVGLGLILGPIQNTVENVTPTWTGPNKAVWYGSHPLDPQEHLLVVRKVLGHYRYALLARLKAFTGDPSAWRLRVVGRTFPDPAGKHGHAWVNLDTDLDEATQGKVLVHWSQTVEERTLTGYFFNVSNGDDAPNNQAVHYVQYNNGAGAFVHAVEGFDLDEGKEGKEALEDGALITRWTATGAGRGDLIATGGDLPSQNIDAAWISQCWSNLTYDTVFESVTAFFPNGQSYLVSSDGDESQCAFSNATQPSVPETGAAPEVEEGDIPEEASVF